MLLEMPIRFPLKMARERRSHIWTSINMRNRGRRGIYSLMGLFCGVRSYDLTLSKGFFTVRRKLLTALEV